MSLEIILLFVVSGMVSGLLGGLLGIGGGIVTVPVLFYSLGYAGIPEDKLMQVAISTSLAATFLTTLASTWAHHRNKGIVPAFLKYLIPGLFLGCAAGSFSAHLLPSFFLREFFGGMAILLGIYLFFPRLPLANFGTAPNSILLFFGIIIGSLSSLLGIGGGIFTVPVLLSYQLSAKNTIATSSASTLTTAFIGTVAYLLIAWTNPSIPETFGYIELPAFFAIGLSSMLLVPLGVKLSYILPTTLIRKIFACLLALTGLAMLLK